MLLIVRSVWATLLVVAVLLLAWAPDRATQTQAGAGGAALLIPVKITAEAGSAPWVRSISFTPHRASVLDTVTFASTFIAGGAGARPYRATLELLPRRSGRATSLTQSGFNLRRGQPLTVYWEWRAGASLRPGSYTVSVQLSEANSSARPLARAMAPQPLTILSR